MKELKAVERTVRRARRHIRFSRGLSAFLRACFWMALVAAGLMTWHKLAAHPLPWGPIAASLAGAALLVGLSAAFVPRVGLVAAAAELDARAGWKSRVSSLMTLPEIVQPMEQALLHDVNERIRGLEVAPLFPVHFPRESRWLPVALLAIGGAFFLPRWAVPVSSPSGGEEVARKEKERVGAAVVKLKKAADDRKKDPDKKMDKANAAGERLQKLATAMQDAPPSRRQMLEKLESEREHLREEKAGFEETRAMADKIQKALEGKQGETGELGEKIREGRFEEAADEIAKMRQKLADGTMTEAEKKELAQEMQALMEKLADSSKRQDLSEFEKSMAEALQGLQNENGQSMEGLEQMLDEMASDLAQSDALQSMMEDLESMTDELAKGDGSCPSCGKPNEGIQKEGG